MVIGWDEEYLAGFPDVLGALSGLDDIGLPEGVGLPGVPVVEVYDDVVLYTFPGDEDVYEGGFVRRAWRRAARADFARKVALEWEPHVARVRAGLPAVERVLRVAELAGLVPAGGDEVWTDLSVTLWLAQGVCLLDGYYRLEVLCGSGGWGAGVRVSSSAGSELVEVTIDRINRGCPWRAPAGPAARLLAAGLGWLADQVDDDEGLFYEDDEDVDAGGEPAAVSGGPAWDEEIVWGEPFTGGAGETVPGGFRGGCGE